MPDADYLWLRKKNRPKLSKEPKKTLRMIDLFAGCGGITVGIDAACHELGIRLETILAWDIFEEATAVYKENFPETTVRNDDIAKIIDGNRGRRHFTRKIISQRGWRHQLVVGGLLVKEIQTSTTTPEGLMNETFCICGWLGSLN